MPLPLTVSCFSKIQIGFTFLVPAHPDSPGKRAIKWVHVSTLQILEKQRMDGSWVCYEQLGGGGVVVISHDWILHLVPYFQGYGEIAPNFAENLTVPSFGKLS